MYEHRLCIFGILTECFLCSTEESLDAQAYQDLYQVNPIANLFSRPMLQSAKQTINRSLNAFMKRNEYCCKGYNHPSQQGMSGQHRADSDTTWQRRIAVGPMLASFIVLAGISLALNVLL